MLRRIAAWLVTGPLGHGWAGALDWLGLLGRGLLGRAASKFGRPGRWKR